MAYTGTDPDGGIGYVTKDDPDPKEYVKSKVQNIIAKVAGIFKPTSRYGSEEDE
ncbi:hypothetical protein [Halobellus marinus]|uniref:hypothetical protein n=1 Tax=Halobellus TaxID=1073986 RepID=UPI0028AEA9D7|nr:hypothetical protein [Halobellus sp. DFY28]